MAAEARVGSDKAVEMFGGAMERFGGAMERFSGAGMALLPWTRHMLVVLWDQLRLLVHVIYYTFISVFQMFRFEVHVRITDDPSVAPDPSDPFLFSTLFSEDAAADHTEALLSTLRGDDLCCEGEAGIFIGHKHPSSTSSSWAVGDWNIFVSSDARCSDEDRSGASCWSSEEEHSLEFDCEESKALWESLSRSNDPYDPLCFSACISTRSSKGLWEKRSPASCSPVSEHMHVHNKMGQSQMTQETEETQSKEMESTVADVCSLVLEGNQSEEENKASWETESKCSDVCSSVCVSPDAKREESKGFCETECICPDTCSPQNHRNALDLNEETSEDESEGSWEIESTDLQSVEEEEKNKGLWETQSGRCTGVPVGRFWESSSEEESDAEDFPVQRRTLVTRSDSDSSWSSENSDWSQTSEQQEENQLLWDLFSQNLDPFNPLCFNATNRSREEEKRREEESDAEEEEDLWSDLTKQQDPYHPLNFTVLQGRERELREEETQKREGRDGEPIRRRRKGEKPELKQRKIQRHSHPPVILCPWTKASSAPSSAPAPEGPPLKHKKVRFSDEVKVHVMRSWRFAHEAARRGQWEEFARDRDRFRRRIQEVERTVGPILRPEHRERVWTRIRPGLNQD
ncbi:protein phosphatase 1 regulatory subunit 15B [Boleophthalmus pectinirostris]|uniref:protein phosphatase 1 regulatory subunit 15B n=1 Tax=Boleophthalmus pectinirostris TaxID=150288 RepID=UPI000A1C74C8|nr:protein phosphatase 1 regulatory subunit 15B [Boleophthalmus pectinirostris]